MAQGSRPQAENKNTNPLYTDSGPYNRDQWAEKLIAEWTGDAVTTRGPFWHYLNRLAVTNPSGVNIQVDTGAGYVNGSLLHSDAAMTFVSPAPAASTRFDLVVMVENNTNVDYNTNLYFPTDLTDYSSPIAGVPAYTARLAVLQGVEGAGVPRALVQTSTIYMVALAEIEVTTVPAIASLTDMRDYADYASVLHRQGVAAVDWWYNPSPAALTNYLFEPAYLKQAGYSYATLTGVYQSTKTITFPVAFADVPLLYVTAHNDIPAVWGANDTLAVFVDSVTASQAVIKARAFRSAGYTAVPAGSPYIFFTWLAIGPPA